MVHPRIAPVKPRGILPETGDAIALEEAIESLIGGRSAGIVEIVGDAGAGKTTALEHLAACNQFSSGVTFLDEPELADVKRAAAESLVIFTTSVHRNSLQAPSIQLAPWGDDDLIEYLFAKHADRCQAVFELVQNDSFREHIGGEPELWRAILDEMAMDDRPAGIRQALSRAVARSIEPAASEAVGDFCLSKTLHDFHQTETLALGDRLRLWDLTASLLRFHPVWLLLAGQRIVELIELRRYDDLPTEAPYELLRESALRIAENQDLIDAIDRHTHENHTNQQAMLASLLHIAGAAWRPIPNANLAKGYFNGAQWRDVDAAGAILERAQLENADLSGADLTSVDLGNSRLRGTNLNGSKLLRARFGGADLRRADLSNADAERSDFRSATLAEAKLDRGNFFWSVFDHANLKDATMVGADLSMAIISAAQVEGLDLTDARLQLARLNRLVLRNTIAVGASFAGAKLSECDLEQMELPSADFANARLNSCWLTASVMPNANFHGASLFGAGLADIEWENADLREADLRECQFHMGSSRSGLVGSPYPGHGSRTGFYTDAFEDRYHKPPEQIRKANLCGADLRGANIEGADFYLVDLRGATLDDDQVDWLRRCSAILDDR
jgi:uncharacterized protein YjbI with pentapeptide repeats